MSNPHIDGPTAAGSAPSWQEAVADGLTRLGWSDKARVEAIASDIAVVLVEAYLDRDVRLDLAGSTTFSLSVVLEGSGRLSVRGRPPIEVGAGMAVLFACRGEASGEDLFRGGQLFRVVDFRFEESFLIRADDPRLSGLTQRYADASGGEGGGVFLEARPAPAILMQIANDITRMPPSAAPERRLYLHAKAIEALAAAIQSLDGDVKGRRSLRPQERERLMRARAILDRDFRRHWTIERLAREVGVNEKQLKYGFRDLVGQPVHAYLTELRLDAAAQMLKQGSSVADAAVSVGFANLSHFSKVFRTHRGVSPSRFARLG
ncbi:helix-turn-helix transcriptional regulator [Methylorubrum suomiense]|uniref:HTH-type transcriptional activator RhaR n=1 Tax=Methylorubrum suomiense TaxID=144191 RepID=A0ABQ4V0W7_9HYPH|nr:MULTISPECIES: AraC family transcriptional regulator [Methylobacteriaceae]GJE76567.1 HTH-type transcriptional activator RhaR [Methylorubrum suomiense]